jgi:hypothetical protein
MGTQKTGKSTFVKNLWKTKKKDFDNTINTLVPIAYECAHNTFIIDLPGYQDSKENKKELENQSEIPYFEKEIQKIFAHSATLLILFTKSEQITNENEIQFIKEIYKNVFVDKLIFITHSDLIMGKILLSKIYQNLKWSEKKTKFLNDIKGLKKSIIEKVPLAIDDLYFITLGDHCRFSVDQNSFGNAYKDSYDYYFRKDLCFIPYIEKLNDEVIDLLTNYNILLSLKGLKNKEEEFEKESKIIHDEYDLNIQKYKNEILDRDKIFLENGIKCIILSILNKKYFDNKMDWNNIIYELIYKYDHNPVEVKDEEVEEDDEEEEFEVEDIE